MDHTFIFTLNHDNKISSFIKDIPSMNPTIKTLKSIQNSKEKLWVQVCLSPWISEKGVGIGVYCLCRDLRDITIECKLSIPRIIVKFSIYITYKFGGKGGEGRKWQQINYTFIVPSLTSLIHLFILWNEFSRNASKPIDIRWIITGSQQILKLM